VDLPLLLAGPILRRVEPERVSIWLATSRPVAARAEVYSDPVKRIPLGSSANNQREGASQVQLGDNLFIHLFEVRPTNGGSGVQKGRPALETDSGVCGIYL